MAFFANEDVKKIAHWMCDTDSKKCYLREWVYVNLDAHAGIIFRIIKYVYRLMFGPMRITTWNNAKRKTGEMAGHLPVIEGADVYMMTNVFTLEQYRYKKKFEPVKEDIVYDCGACVGDTAIWYANKVERVVAFEPDPDNVIKLQKNLKRNNIENVFIVAKGVAATSGEMRFDLGQGDSSKAQDSGTTIISVCSIDDYAQLHQEAPTIIKMDIEGAEIDALKGAKNTIILNKPKLAICIYHNPQVDMICIPTMLKEWRPDYQMFCRKIHHYRETVLFAV